MAKRLKQLTFAPDSYNHLVELIESYAKENGEDVVIEEMQEALILLGEDLEEMAIQTGNLDLEESFQYE